MIKFYRNIAIIGFLARVTLPMSYAGESVTTQLDLNESANRGLHSRLM